VVTVFPDPTVQVYDVDWAPPLAVSVTVQVDGTVGGLTTLLPGVVGSPCALKVIVGLAGIVVVWTARVVEVVELVELVPVAWVDAGAPEAEHTTPTARRPGRLEAPPGGSASPVTVPTSWLEPISR
jgi:hypothetical protein